MNPEQLIRSWAAAKTACIKAALSGPKEGDEGYEHWLHNVFRPLSVAEYEAGQAMLRWAESHPVDGEHCEHCPESGRCDVCRRAA